jgi:hypothetical protein
MRRIFGHFSGFEFFCFNGESQPIHLPLTRAVSFQQAGLIDEARINFQITCLNYHNHSIENTGGLQENWTYPESVLSRHSNS